TRPSASILSQRGEEASESGCLKLTCVSPYPREGAGSRYRLTQFFPLLEKAGFACNLESFYSPRSFGLAYSTTLSVPKVVSFVQASLRRLAVMSGLTRGDAAIVYREAFPIGPPLFERWAGARGVRLGYDFDDAVYLPNVSDANRVFGKLKNPGKTGEIIGLC